MTPLRTAEAIAELSPAPSELTETQVTDPDDETFGTVSGSVLLISGNTTTRQTVQSGPVDADGRADFLDVGTGLQVVSDTSASLNITFGDGFSRGQQRNFGVSIDTALTWSSLPDNEGEVFLFIRVLPNGTVETFHSLLKPVYAQARPSTPATGQTFYPTDHRHRMEVWDGAAWDDTNLLICVGQCATSAGSVASVVSYAYGGRAESDFLQGANATAFTFSHNIGTDRNKTRVYARFRNNQQGWIAGDVIDVSASFTTTSTSGQGISVLTGNLSNTRNHGGGGFQYIRRDTFATTAVPNFNLWDWRTVVERAF